MELAPHPPYWGPIDAYHQFCEAKYAASPFVAEFWNTFSNIPCFIGPGLYALYRGAGSLDRRGMLMWVFMVIVGVGSFMFHCSMRFKWEMLDELPMLLLVLSGIISKDDTHWFMSGMFKHLVHLVCFTLCIGGTYLYLSASNYELFLHTFTAIIVVDVGLAFVCMRKFDKHGSRVGMGCLIMYVGTLGSGRVAWEIENSSCTPGTGGGLALLHVVWHALAGMGCYFGILADIHNRHAVLGVGIAVDAPEAMWPLVGLISAGWRRPVVSKAD